MRLPRPPATWTRRGRVWIAVAAVLVLAAVAVLVALVRDTEPDVASEDVTISTPSGPGESNTVEIDATLYLPDSTPAPTVLLAHGFGGSKDSTAGQARRMAADGFVVLAYSARGFGRSNGEIWINDPDREVADARALVSWLAERPEVELDGPGDPRVGVGGSSYGGALALMLGGSDPRVDAIAAGITWYDLGQALFPNGAVPPSSAVPSTGGRPPTPAAVDYPGDGVLKRGWAGAFFSAGSASQEPGAPETPGGTGLGCGRFAVPVCLAYAGPAVTGTPTPELLAFLRSHSPAALVGNVTAPTLLVQGQRDTLFGLEQADANARAIAAAGAPVEVRWFNGGHDGDAGRADGAIRGFLEDRLRGSDDSDGPAPFNFALPGTPNEEGEIPARRMVAAEYPGLAGTDETTPHTVLSLNGGTQIIARPPGAAPSAVSSVPGVGDASTALAALGVSGLSDPPGQTAVFRTDTLTSPVTITGTSTVDVRIEAVAAPGEAVLFAKLYDVSSAGRKALPGGGVSAIRVPDAGSPVDLRISLPAIAYQVPEGHYIEVAVVATDQAYAVPVSPAQYTVSLTDPRLFVPSVPARPAARAVPIAPLVGIGLLALGVAAAVVTSIVLTRRRGVAEVDPDLVDVPIVVRDLEKVYDNGLRAVDGVGFTVEHGQVLGLLGPNGAGKTTTLRVALGLIAPTAGEVRIFGHTVGRGAPVLSRVGAFVEGPGLLPHLSGMDNLRLYWAATGRPDEDAHLDEVLQIADLGSAIHRRVRSYSHGMRQRVAIAQAMLGLPDLLILDEPTNGLDPPQIRTMRDVLIEYARRGRTVVVSSHLLAEVEQTCTHVVVMNRGRVISAGPVRELVAAGGPTEFRVDDAARASAALSGLAGLGSVVTTNGENPKLRVELGSAPTSDVVRALVEAGVSVRGVSTTTRLEDVFLRLVHDPRAGEGVDGEPVDGASVDASRLGAQSVDAASADAATVDAAANDEEGR
ncbi:MAG TPA: alpha/beta fold hydrolase [Aldersonia sp.]